MVGWKLLILLKKTYELAKNFSLNNSCIIRTSINITAALVIVLENLNLVTSNKIQSRFLVLLNLETNRIAIIIITYVTQAIISCQWQQLVALIK